MAYYFFTELDKLNNQNTSGNGEAYGPISVANSKDRFRVTSTHKVSTDAKVIAVCKGIILVQEQTEDLVNIILKPFEQPPFEFPKIKYFIYRGVKKSSLVSGSILVAKNTNDLTNSLWTDYNAYNNLTNQAPPQELLGLGMNIANVPYKNTDLIDGVFYETGTSHQLPTVQAGWHIANFDDDIGFEIMFESLGFEPTLAIARKADNIIEVNTLTGITQAEFFEHWHDKEDILNYIDPCAFWGSFYTHNLIVKLSNNTKNKKKGDELYTDVLSLFKNKNKCYIDIRNEFNFSLNYFKNYGTSATDNTTEIKLRKGSNTIPPIDYYSNGWPIFIIDNTVNAFSSTTNHYQEISLQLPCGNGDNPAPLVYFSRAYKTGIKFPETFNLKQNFLPLTVSSNYTPVFKVAIPWISGNLCCSFIKIKLCKRKSTATLPTIIPTQIRRSDNIDAIFRTKMNFDSSVMNLTTKIFEEEIYIDAINTEGFDGVFNLGTSFDANNVTLFACPVNYLKFQNNKTRDTLRIVADKTNNNYLKKLGENTETAELTKKEVNTSEDDVDVIFFLENNIGFNKPFNKVELNHLLGIGFFITEWNTLLTYAVNISNFTIKYPVWISIDNKQNIVNNEGYYYTKFDLILKGFKVSGTSVSIVTVNANLKQYSNGHI